MKAIVKVETISNRTFVIRLVVAAVTFTVIGFTVGYFGPIYLLPDAGVAPVTGYFAAPVGTLIGILAATWGSMKGFKPTAYMARVAVIAAIFAALTLLQFLV